VLNRVPPRAALTAHMITRLGQYKVRVARSSLGNRIAFAESIGAGRTVLETKPSSIAAEETRKLAAEILRRAN
jgi:chromosome partitioning protein